MDRRILPTGAVMLICLFLGSVLSGGCKPKEDPTAVPPSSPGANAPPPTTSQFKQPRHKLPPLPAAGGNGAGGTAGKPAAPSNL